jgi:hypothetical protein
MEAKNNRFWKVVKILRSWKASDAAEEASPNDVAEEIDKVYDEYLAALPARTAVIREGQNESERKAA